MDVHEECGRSEIHKYMCIHIWIRGQCSNSCDVTSRIAQFEVLTGIAIGSIAIAIAIAITIAIGNIVITIRS